MINIHDIATYIGYAVMVIVMGLGLTLIVLFIRAMIRTIREG